MNYFLKVTQSFFEYDVYLTDKFGNDRSLFPFLIKSIKGLLKKVKKIIYSLYLISKRYK